MKKLSVVFYFCLVIVLMLFNNVFFPKLSFHPVLPFLVRLYSTLSFTKALWISGVCGFILDLLSSEFKLGLLGTSYVVTTAVIYRYKKFFFSEKPLAFVLFTMLASFLSMTIHWILIYLFDQDFSFSLLMFINNQVMICLLDGTLALLLTLGPPWIYKTAQNIRRSFLLQKENIDEIV